MTSAAASAFPAQLLNLHEQEQNQKHSQFPRESIAASARPATRAALGEVTLDQLNHQGGAEDLKADALADQLSRLCIAASPANSTRQLDTHFQILRSQRPRVQCNAFDSLNALPKERSSQEDQSNDAPLDHHLRPTGQAEQGSVQKPMRQDPHTRNEINKHLQGQYEWLISYSTPACSAKPCGSDAQPDDPTKTVTFGCNLLSLNKAPLPRNTPVQKGLADTYTLIATPLKGDASILPQLGGVYAVAKPGEMECSDPPSPPPPPHGSTGVLDSGASSHFKEHASSPILSAKSSFNFDEAASPALSHSGPRIEDSLAEIDDLEDELEALSRFAQSNQRQDASGNNNSSPKPQIKERSVLGSPATLRVKAVEKAQPTVRRAASLTLRDKTDRKVEGREVRAHTKSPPQSPVATCAKSGSLRANGSPNPAKSTKPLTKPNFELPGEAVSRRLKELREARQAQQAEAQEKTTATAPRIKSSKPLTRPDFELPGEAISRRKREEREAKLRAQEEEEQKRREFKARPNRANGNPSTMPRGTVASRARQDRIQNAAASKTADSNTVRHPAAVGVPRIGPASQSLRELSSRGRHSIVFPTDTNSASRGTSASTTLSGKRSSVSIEDIAQHRMRGKDILEGDRNYLRTKEMTKLEREAAAKSARESAAERSRAITREWAERKRQKEAAMK